ncbi:MAG TPA: M20/M25/M40 family metallo-hydrolase [Candidatus Limnocylindria bacterium]|nr:M20/M25/M40 family metallo-hydrolase [Candidatus Limnocylindria bacterium]
MIPISPADVEACVERLRDLIRIPSVNPPDGGVDVAAGRDPRGGETAVATHCAEELTAAGIAAEVIEAAPGRGSCFARLPATVADPEPPLVLLSHVDVVPVDAESWTHDPFGGELVDGVIWGRGAIDMKDMLAMELGVLLALHRSGAERRRDVILAAVADEEAGGEFGALHWVRTRPDLFADGAGRPAAAALNEVGGYPIHLGGRRFYAIQVAEKGILWTRITASGTPGHGSMPHADNPTVKLARAVTRLAEARQPMRLTPVVEAFLRGMGMDAVADAVARGAEDELAAILDAGLPDPVMRRSLDAMLRDTVTPTILRSGKKMNVIPGSGDGEIDVRTLPDTDQDAFLAQLQAIAGDEVTLSAVMAMPPVEAPADAPIVDLMHAALRRADPEGTPLPMMITPGTDAKALALLGIPTYGFAPLLLDPDTPFLSLFHAHDERVPASALAFGLPVLADVVGRFVIAR